MSDLPQQQYQAPMPPPPPPKKKGLSPWLLCGIIACSGILIVIVSIVIFTMKMAGPMMKVGKAVGSTDLATIQAAAVVVDGEALANSYSEYEGQWLELNDTVAVDTGTMPQTGTAQGAAIILSSGIMLQDVTSSSSAQPGDQIRAWGQVAEFNIPGVDFESEGIAPIMFIAKQVDVLTGDEPEAVEQSEPITP